MSNCFSFKTVLIRVVLSFRIDLTFDDEDDDDDDGWRETIGWLGEFDVVDDEEDVGGGRNGMWLGVARKKSELKRMRKRRERLPILDVTVSNERDDWSWLESSPDMRRSKIKISPTIIYHYYRDVIRA